MCRYMLILLLLAASDPVAAGPPAPAPGGPPASAPAGPDMVVQAVDRAVASFPEADDLRTPAAAYATVNRRCMAILHGDWATYSVRRLGLKPPPASSTPQRRVDADRWLQARILEVRSFRGRTALVLARVSDDLIDARTFECEAGQWRNAGEDQYRPDELDGARAKFAAWCSRDLPRPWREKVADPDRHLAAFTAYLEQHGRAPKALLLDALATHELVILGESHHRPTYWALAGDLVRDPRFARSTGTVYLELPSHDQALIDQFLAAPRLDRAPVIRMLRDMFWMGWPDQGMCDFFVAVWEANQPLPADRRVRIVLVDMPRPWSEFQTPRDVGQYDTDRDALMARNLLADRAAQAPDPRGGLFIAGYAHVALHAAYPADWDSPLPTAGARLRRALGAQVYAVLEHGPVLGNVGTTRGRTALGLFDAAFAARGHRPVAFALAGGPFGTRRFDANLDWPDLASRFEDVFDAYLYLGPLEEERCAALIPGFYTDEFAREAERRAKLTNPGGPGLATELGQATVDGAGLAAWMARSWGQPRDWTRRLGPADAWKDGDAWENLALERAQREAKEKPEVIRAAAQRFFDELRRLDDHDPAAARRVEYQARQGFEPWAQWVSATFRQRPITEVDLGDMSRDEQGRPSIAYTLLLQDGTELAGDLPFVYVPLVQAWVPVEGADWHRRPPLPPLRPRRPGRAAPR